MESVHFCQAVAFARALKRIGTGGLTSEPNNVLLLSPMGKDGSSREVMLSRTVIVLIEAL